MKNSNIGFCEFSDYFTQGQYKNNFSYEGLRALYEYLTELEEDLDTEFEIDVVAFCCDYSEYEDMEEFLEDYKDFKECGEDLDEEDKEEAIKEGIREHATLIEVEGDGFIVGCF